MLSGVKEVKSGYCHKKWWYISSDGAGGHRNYVSPGFCCDGGVDTVEGEWQTLSKYNQPLYTDKRFGLLKQTLELLIVWISIDDKPSESPDVLKITFH